MIAIEKLKESIIINNKGELLFPEEEFGKKSESRNRLLSDLLSKTEYMEKAGTGIKRIRDACDHNGNSVEFSFSDSFRVEIRSNKEGDVPENVPENRSLKIINSIESNNRITINELSELLKVDSKTIKRDINKLKKNNILKRIGPDKGGHWEIMK